jgi:hypothetical protein
MNQIISKLRMEILFPDWIFHKNNDVYCAFEQCGLDGGNDEINCHSLFRIA